CPSPPYPPRHLEEKSRFADARVTADEDDHTRQQPSAQDAVELVDAGGQSFSLIGADVRDGDRGHGHWSVTVLLTWALAGGAFLDETVPLPALGASPKPLAVLVPTDLTDVYAACLPGHNASPGRRNVPLRPPRFSMRRMSVMVMSRSTALHIS